MALSLGGAVGHASGTQTAALDCLLPTPVTLTDNPQFLGSGLEVLFDPERRYAVAQVTESELCEQFQPISGMPRFPIERRGIWLRFRLPQLDTAEQPWRVLAPFMGTERFCAHWPLQSGAYRSACGDIRDAQGEGMRTRAGWYAALPAGLDATRPALLYLEGENVSEVPIEVGTADAFVLRQHNHQTWYGLFYGVLLSAVALGLIVYVAQRDTTYLYLSGYLGALGLYTALRENHLSSLGLAGWAATPVLAPAASLIVIFGTQFYQRFLDSGTHVPVLHRVLWIGTGLAIVPLVVFPVLSPEIARVALGILFPLYLLPLLAVILVRLAQGSRLAAYALIAFASLGAGGTFRILELLGLTPVDSATTRLFTNSGILLASGFLAVGLIDRVHGLMQERNHANELAVSSQRLALHRAHYDELTRLPNRIKFREELHGWISNALSGHWRFAIITLGLNRFSAINHAFGHHVGDHVLQEVAKRIRQQIPSDALLGRTGPDVFSCAINITRGEAGVAAVLERQEALQNAVATPLEMGGGITLSASAGLALYPDHASTADQLIQCGETALHYAKDRGPGAPQMFEPDMHRNAGLYLEMNKDLHRALERGELQLHYQPIVSFLDDSVLRAEALARWRREDGTYVPPDQFLPIMETGDLPRPFTEWAIATACRQLADWRARRLRLRSLSINLSAAQLRIPHLHEYILGQLQQSELPGGLLTIEVTEGALIDNLDAARDMLMKLRLQGLSVAVDDFGIGYASPNYLRVLPVNALKIEGVFLKGVPQDREACALLDGIIAIGRSLHLKIVAEGIESEEQAAYLRSRRVSAGQGFWYSRALPAAEFEEWVQQRPRRSNVRSIRAA